MDDNEMMTEEQETALIIKGLVYELPEPQQERVKECVVKLQDIVKEYGECGLFALAVVGSVEAAKQ